MIKIVNAMPIEDFCYFVNAINQIKMSFKEGERHFINKYLIEDLKLDFTYIGSGSYGQVYCYRNYVIKFFYRSGMEALDPLILEKIQSEYFPKLYFYEQDFYMVSEKINGHTLDVAPYIINNYQSILLNAVNFVISKGISPHDFSDSNTIIKENGIPIIVDVGNYRVSSEYPQTYISDIKRINFKGTILNQEEIIHA